MNERLAFRGTLVRPLADQGDRSHNHIDPAGVRFDPETDYPIHVEFDYSKPPVGFGRVSRAEDGSLRVEGEISPGQHPWQLAIGVYSRKSLRTRDRHVIEESDILSISLTDRHDDPDQPVVSCRIVKP